MSGDQLQLEEPQQADVVSKQDSAAELTAKKELVEAALYAAGYPLELKTLCSITKTYSKKKVYELAKSLMDEYRRRDSALEVVELEDRRFVMQLKPRFVARVRRLSIKPLLTEGPLKTLSYIAYRQPVPQAKVIAVRGVQAYEHIGKLVEMGLITREKFGKSSLLRTSELFADYFNLNKNFKLMKKQLEILFSESDDKPQKPSE